MQSDEITAIGGYVARNRCHIQRNVVKGMKAAEIRVLKCDVPTIVVPALHIEVVTDERKVL